MNTTFTHFCSRRGFIQKSFFAAATLPLAADGVRSILGAEALAAAKVAVVECKNYGPAVAAAYKAAFDLLGGIDSLVKGKSVTVKLNLTGQISLNAWGGRWARPT